MRLPRLFQRTTQGDDDRTQEPVCRYFKYDGHNFGDNLNDVLVPRLFSVGEFVPQGKTLPTGTHIVAIGSILNDLIRLDQHSNVVVYDAGAGYRPAVQNLSNFHIVCVMGRLTCALLDLEKALGGWPTALIPRAAIIDPFHRDDFTLPQGAYCAAVQVP